QRGSGVGAGARDRPIAGFLGHQTRVGVVAVGVRGSTLVAVALHLAEVVVRPALRVAVGVRFVNQVAIDVVSVRGRFTERCGAGQHPVLAVVGVGDGVFGGIRGVAILQVGTADAAIGGHAVAMGIEHIGFLRHLAARGTAGVELEVALPRHLVEVVVGGVGDVAERAGGGLHGWGFGGDRAPQGVVGRIGPSPRAILRHGLVAGGIVGVLRNVVVLVRAEHQLAVDVVVPGLGWRGPDVGTRGRHRKHVGLGFPNLVVLAVVLVGRHVAVGIRGGGHIAPTVVGEALTGAVLASSTVGARHGFRAHLALQVIGVQSRYGRATSGRDALIGHHATGQIVGIGVHRPTATTGRGDLLARVVVGVLGLVTAVGPAGSAIALGNHLAERVVLLLYVAVVGARIAALDCRAQQLVVRIVGIGRGNRDAGRQRVARGEHVAVGVVGGGVYVTVGIDAFGLLTQRIVGGVALLCEATSRNCGTDRVAESIVHIGRRGAGVRVERRCREIIGRVACQQALPVTDQRITRWRRHRKDTAKRIVGGGRDSAVDVLGNDPALTVVGVAG